MHHSTSLLSSALRQEEYEGLSNGLPLALGYELGFATNREELRRIQKLRFQVFNMELGEGLPSSNLTGLDQDNFDEQCHHLFVRETQSGAIVGTYRLQTFEVAKQHLGFYSATIFDFAQAPLDVLENAVELGRACIHPDHRRLNVLFLLWKGLGHYARFFQKRYLFGCCSLTSQQESEGWRVYASLKSNDQIHGDIHIQPLSTHRFYSAFLSSTTPEKPPKLMRAYLSLGAKIASPPAIDRAFKTIDFLAVFDISDLGKVDPAFFHLST